MIITTGTEVVGGDDEMQVKTTAYTVKHQMIVIANS